jgi:hypothetical protein
MAARRNYRMEYQKYQASTSAKLDRAARNRARRELMAKGIVHKGDGKDVDHKNSNPRDNSADNLRVTSAHLNRGKLRVKYKN